MADTPQAGSIPGQPAIASAGTTPDFAGLGGDPSTGGLPAVLDRLRDAAESHDGELTGPGGLDQLAPEQP
jgi:hypothetical protein